MTESEVQRAFDRWRDDARENPDDFDVAGEATCPTDARVFLDYLAETRCVAIGL